MTVDSYLHQGKQFFARWAASGRVRGAARAASCGAAGLLLSAAGLFHQAQPFAAALVSVMTGWRAAVMGLGSVCGYLLFWGVSGVQGAVWSLLSCASALLAGKSRMIREAPSLIPALTALWVAATGLAFQLSGAEVSTAAFLLRVGLAWGSSQLFSVLKRKQEPLLLWCAAGVYLLAAVLSGERGASLLPGLILGGLLLLYLPKWGQTSRRGEIGLAQVRLELMAEVLGQTRLLLLETEDASIDEEALLIRARERSCGSCPNRRTCRAPEQIPRELLRRPLTENTSLPFFCRKPGRMVLEIRRCQEQYRLLRADRDRRQEYRAAVGQQYVFLSEFLREQSALLARRGKKYQTRFDPEVAWAARSKEPENGDRFRHFSGPGGRYFLLLCDGMGTGMGAAEEGRNAASLLQQMLTAGFPASHALESLNSLLALRGRAGAVSVDLAELHLDTGSAAVYKWGAAPSYLIRAGTAEKIGTAGPPPGIRAADLRERQERLSLRRGEVLIILSDGVDGEKVRRRAVTMAAVPAGEMAARLLDAGAEGASDDATVAVVRLRRDVDIIPRSL